MASKNEHISLKPLSPPSSPTKASRTPESGNLNTEKAEKSSAVGGQAADKVKERGGGKNIENKELKTRATLEKELAEKTQQLGLLERQMKQQEDSLRDRQSQEDLFKNLYEGTKTELARAQEELKSFADLKQKNVVLSEENCNLRESLKQKDAEVQRLKGLSRAEETLLETQNNPVQKILRKENDELHQEKEQLRVERDRLRRSLKEKQDQIEKMNTSIGELQDQLLHAKQSLEERTRASTLLEDRLANIDGELAKYRERLAAQGDKTEQGNANGAKGLRNRRPIELLQRKEEKLLQDRQQLEKQVNMLSAKIKHLESQRRNSRTGKRPTTERGSQTDLVTAGSTTKKDSPGKANAVRKYKGIIKSLGRFFEELIQNNQDSPKESSRGRRTAIAARRANDLLRELSVSIDYLVSPSQGSGGKSGPQAPSGGRRSKGGVDGSLWDKVSHEVAHHEFTFDTPMKRKQGNEDEVDKDKEVKRAEKGLNKLYHASSSSADPSTRDSKQTEMMVRELLRQHHDEIKNLVEKACNSSAPVAATMSMNYKNTEGNGNDEASLAVQELDNFKTRTAKVQSLVMKMQAFIESSKNERDDVYSQLQTLENELRQKEALLQAKTQELRRRHCKSLDTEKGLLAQIDSLKEEKTRTSNEIARLHELCRHKDHQMVDKVQEVKGLHAEIAKREKTHKENLSKMKKKVEEAWNQYASVKVRAEKRSAEFNDAAEKLKVSQGYLLDLWQTLKTVDNVVETNGSEDL